jgi:hypothetical protein
MFRALLDHSQEALHERYLVYCVRIMSTDCGTVAVKLPGSFDSSGFRKGEQISHSRVAHTIGGGL